MPIFALENFNEVKGNRITFNKLKVDDNCLLDEFENNIKGNKQYYSEYKTILSYMNLAANGICLPNTKFNIIKSGKFDVLRFEFKSKHLRVYGFGNFNDNKVIVLGGMKKNQDKDIESLNRILSDYLKQ